METSSHGPLACSAAAQNQPSSPVSSPVQATVGRVARSDGAARRKVRQGRDGACHRGRWNGADAAGYGGSWRWWSVASVLFLGHCSNRPDKAKATRAEEYKPTAAAAQGDCLHARVRHKICWLRTFLFARMLLDDLARSGLYTHTDRRHALTLAHIRSTTRQRTMHTFARKVTRPLPSKGHVVLARLRDGSVASSMRNRCEFAWLVFASAVCRSTGSSVSDHIYPCVSDEIRQVTPDG